MGGGEILNHIHMNGSGGISLQTVIILKRELMHSTNQLTSPHNTISFIKKYIVSNYSLQCSCTRSSKVAFILNVKSQVMTIPYSSKKMYGTLHIIYWPSNNMLLLIYFTTLYINIKKKNAQKLCINISFVWMCKHIVFLFKYMTWINRIIYSHTNFTIEATIKYTFFLNNILLFFLL